MARLGFGPRYDCLLCRAFSLKRQVQAGWTSSLQLPEQSVAASRLP